MESFAFRLRPYHPSDFDVLHRIDQACFPPGIAYGRAEMRFYLRANGAFCLIAEASGETVGFILAEVSARRAHVITLDVLEPFRRRSIGSRLLDAVEQAAAERGAPRMVLETATTNHAAIALWKKHGYRELVTIADYYGPGRDAFEMEKRLDRLSQKGRVHSG